MVKFSNKVKSQIPLSPSIHKWLYIWSFAGAGAAASVVGHHDHANPIISVTWPDFRIRKRIGGSFEEIDRDRDFDDDALRDGLQPSVHAVEFEGSRVKSCA